jgi:hypothetical protein
MLWHAILDVTEAARGSPDGAVPRRQRCVLLGATRARLGRRSRLVPTRDLEFVLADGTSIERQVSDCRFIYEGIEAPSPVILGVGDDVGLLGTVTLDTLGLILNPLRRTLSPMRMRLASCAVASYALPRRLCGPPPHAN